MKERMINMIPLCGFSLIFSVDYAIHGLILALGILFFYPPLAVSCRAVKKTGQIERGYTIMLFLSVLLMGLYLDFIGSFDAESVRTLIYKAPASMAAGPFLILGFSSPQGGSSSERERRMISEAVVVALLIFVFSLLRDIVGHQSLDFRFAGWGALIPLDLPLFSIPARFAGFLAMALFLGILSFFEEAPRA